MRFRFPKIGAGIFYYSAFVAILAWASNLGREPTAKISRSVANEVFLSHTYSTPLVIPVLLVSSDMLESPDLQKAIENLNSVIEYTQAWYRAQVGKTFNLGKVQILESRIPASEWIALSIRSQESEHRFDYYDRVREEVSGGYPNAKDRQHLVAVFAGIRPEVWWGAADSGDVSVTAPRGSSVYCPRFQNDDGKSLDEVCADAVYAAAHELGHAFGLSHSCEEQANAAIDPNCEKSVMQAQRPPGMILLESEKDLLKKHPFFN